MLHEHNTFELAEDELPIASLGPKSSVGEISLTLGVPEPVTVRAITTVNVLALSRVDFIRESGADRADLHAPPSVESKLRCRRMPLVAWKRHTHRLFLLQNFVSSPMTLSGSC